jgi:Protein of unknown function (DUF4012)
VRSTRRRRWRSHRLLAAGITIAVLAGIGGGSALGYTALKMRADRLQAVLTADLLAGQRELEAGKASITQANTKRDLSLVTQAVDHFSAARVQFLAAIQLADNSNLLRDLELIPVLSGSVRSKQSAVDGVAGMGAALSEAGEELASLDGQLIKPSANGQAGHTLLTTLDQTQASLVKVRLDLDRAQRAADEVDIQVLPVGQQASFLKARDAIVAGESGLDEFGRLVPVIKEVMGGNGPRTYLVEQVNPAELRAGGGFIGTYSVLRADQGTLTLIKSGNAADLIQPRPNPGQPGFIPLPSPYREVIPQVSWSFIDSNIFPDFPSNAKAAVGFVQPRLGTNIDGVISIDYYAVAKMLELTGPLAVPGFGLTVDATNFIPQLIKIDIAGGASRKPILSALAGPLIGRVTTLPPERWPTLVASLNALAAERHLQAYFSNGLVENEIERIGWSGGVNPTFARDYMMEVESNYYGTKSNYFLTRHYTVALSRIGGMLHHRVTVDVINGEPCGSEERTTYKVNVRLYVSGIASSISDNLRAVRYPNPNPPAGVQLLDGWLPDIACGGGRGQAVFNYDTPWPPADRAVYQTYWQKQPGTVQDKVDVTWNDGSGHTFAVSGNLSQDLVITMKPAGVTLIPGQPALATLPSLGLG